MEMDEIRKVADEIRQEQEQENEQHTNAVVQRTERPITDVSVNDIKVHIDETKPFDQQAEEAANAMATARAVQDETTVNALADQKAQELLSKGAAKVKTAEAAALNAETDVQEAQRKRYEAVLSDFGIREHLPRFLMCVLTVILSPLYVIKTILIGVPFAIAKTIVDNLDGVMCRYEDVNEKVKPRVKAGFIFIVILVVLIAAALITLACLHII